MYFFPKFSKWECCYCSYEKKKSSSATLALDEGWELPPPLHPNQPLWQDEEAHTVLVMGTKGTVLVSSADDLIPFTSTANFNQEGEKGTSSMGSSTELICLLKRVPGTLSLHAAGQDSRSPGTPWQSRHPSFSLASKIFVFHLGITATSIPRYYF